MATLIRIGTRESPLALWQATEVQKLLLKNGTHSELVYIKSEGDLDLSTPLYELGVQGIFTRALDAALLQKKIDIAVHSMKDVPTQLPKGIVQAAVLKRGPVSDLLVVKKGTAFLDDENYVAHIATSSLRRRAQWLHRYPKHVLHNLRGNMQTRLEKLHKENWDAAIFAQAGLERIDLRPENSFEISWMLPAPAQGAIMVVGRQEEDVILGACKEINDRETALCTYIERSFLRGLLGGCSTPVSAFAQVKDKKIHFRGNIFSPDGTKKVEIERESLVTDSENLGTICAEDVLNRGGREINVMIREQMKKSPSP
ncbi:MAG: hydroxymethylbilane synthase [Chitinophagaceae bacterium]|nr:hydroxymethylbilane synthase [Chitinophagaceae bacterium]